MIESFLINAGLGCGTKKKFASIVAKHDQPRWYFLTPVKVSGNGLKTAVLNMAFPFPALKDEIEEKAVLERLELIRKDYEDGLMSFLRKYNFIVPPDTANFSIIPFYANENGERTDRRDLGGTRVHILSANITVKYRNLPLTTAIDSTLFWLKYDQAQLETRINTQTTYNAGAEFQTLSQSEQDLLTAQLAAMNDYNDCLKTRILNY